MKDRCVCAKGALLDALFDRKPYVNPDCYDHREFRNQLNLDEVIALKTRPETDDGVEELEAEEEEIHYGNIPAEFWPEEDQVEQE